MKIWTSAQRAVEKKVDHYIHQLERLEEKECLEHMAMCGAILKENKPEIEAYMAYRFPEKHKETTTDKPADNT